MMAPRLMLIFSAPGDRAIKYPQKHRSDTYEKDARSLRFGGERWENLAIARHQTALAKVPLVAEYIRELFRGGSGKITIFAHHQDVIAALKGQLLEFEPVTLTGGDSATDRLQAVERFQSDPVPKSFIGNIKAAGTGITLAPASSQCVFTEVSWVPAEMSRLKTGSTGSERETMCSCNTWSWKKA